MPKAKSMLVRIEFTEPQHIEGKDPSKIDAVYDALDGLLHAKTISDFNCESFETVSEVPLKSDVVREWAKKNNVKVMELKMSDACPDCLIPWSQCECWMKG